MRFNMKKSLFQVILGCIAVGLLIFLVTKTRSYSQNCSSGARCYGSCGVKNNAKKLASQKNQQFITPLVGSTEQLLCDSIDTAIKNNPHLVIKFYATWCPPCQKMAPVVQDIAKEFAGKSVIFTEVNVSDKALFAAMKERYNFKTIPMIKYYRNGTLVAQHGTETKDTITRNIKTFFIA